MRKIVSAIVLIASLQTVYAQDNSNFKMFNHLDLGVTLGTTGIGIDAAMPVGNYVKLRAGFEVMPHFDYDMLFEVGAFDESGLLNDKPIGRMSEILYSLTGFKTAPKITMIGKPSMWNFKFLVDIYPFKNNKHWHVTAGFHWGSSKIGEAVNSLEDSPSLFSIGMYNHLYYVSYQDWVLGIPTPLIETETTGPIYLDPYIEAQIVDNGRMGIPVGIYSNDITDDEGNVIHQKGEGYFIEPNENSIVHADASVNSFKPYVGIGYEGRLIKGNNNYKIGFDAGVMFWGGIPDVITHDGTNITKDVENHYFRLGHYIDIVKKFKAYPVVNLRITRTIF